MVSACRAKGFDWFVIIFLAAVAAICVLPMLYVLSISLTPFNEVQRNGGFILIPRSVTLEAYSYLLKDSDIHSAFQVTTFTTVVGTVCNMAVTVLIAYPLSRIDLPGRRFFTNLVIFTMMFNGGMIPTYLVVKSLGLLDKIWALILPQLVWSFNLMIIKSFFQSLPDSILESAHIDGAGEFRTLIQIVLPLSLPVMLTVGLYYAVGHWNQYFQSVLYITDRNLRPIQVVVREILALTNNPLADASQTVPTMTTQMASIIIAAVPIITMYPFVQRFFVKGVMLGAVKG